jgi:predicted membrane-bound mannosyltransferase
MIPLDLPILVLGVAGGLIVAFRARDRLTVVIGLWAAGITAAYSLIQYKTPWIVVNMLVPLALLGGLLMAELWRSRIRLAVPLIVVAAIAVNGYQAIDLNFNRYDDQTEAYVYVHSTRDMLAMIDEIQATAARAGTGKDTGIVFMTPEYWPLPWYFRDYPKAGFFGSIVDTQEAMIVANVNQEAELTPKIQGSYELFGQYNLRPGVDLALYIRADIPRE